MRTILAQNIIKKNLDFGNWAQKKRQMSGGVAARGCFQAPLIERCTNFGESQEKNPPEWRGFKGCGGRELLHIGEHGHDKGRLGHEEREHPLQDVVLRFKQVGLGQNYSPMAT